MTDEVEEERLLEEEDLEELLEEERDETGQVTVSMRVFPRTIPSVDVCTSTWFEIVSLHATVLLMANFTQSCACCPGCSVTFS